MRNTLHLDASQPSEVTRAAELLRESRLVAFATETVYGLGANALSAEAVAGIFAAKKRPSWDPLIVHVASVAQLVEITRIPSNLGARIEALADAFWPGPLTLLLPRSAVIPDAVTAGRDLVGVRIPAHPAALALLAETGLPIAAPSANLFGHTSPTTAAHVLADLDGRIDAVLDAGPTNIGVESTVLDPTQTPMVLYRPGAITPEQLTAATGIAVTIHEPPDKKVTTPREALPAPGVGLRHYAPHTQLKLVDGTIEALVEAIDQLQSTSKAVTLLPTDWHPTLPPNVIAEPWAIWGDLEDLAAVLFSALRNADDLGATVILCPLPPPGGLADAIRDRLFKAATPA